MLSNIKQLENKGYIISKENTYFLTNSTKMKISNFLNLNNNLDNIYNFNEYLNNHLVKVDDLEVLSKIPSDTEYEIINNTPLEPYKVVNNFSNNVSE